MVRLLRQPLYNANAEPLIRFLAGLYQVQCVTETSTGLDHCLPETGLEGDSWDVTSPHPNGRPQVRVSGCRAVIGQYAALCWSVWWLCVSYSVPC